MSGALSAKRVGEEGDEKNGEERGLKSAEGGGWREEEEEVTSQPWDGQAGLGCFVLNGQYFKLGWSTSGTVGGPCRQLPD